MTFHIEPKKDKRTVVYVAGQAVAVAFALSLAITVFALAIAAVRWAFGA